LTRAWYSCALPLVCYYYPIFDRDFPPLQATSDADVPRPPRRRWLQATLALYSDRNNLGNHAPLVPKTRKWCYPSLYSRLPFLGDLPPLELTMAATYRALDAEPTQMTVSLSEISLFCPRCYWHALGPIGYDTDRIHGLRGSLCIRPSFFFRAPFGRWSPRVDQFLSSCFRHFAPPFLLDLLRYVVGPRSRPSDVNPMTLRPSPWGRPCKLKIILRPHFLLGALLFFSR